MKTTANSLQIQDRSSVTHFDGIESSLFLDIFLLSIGALVVFISFAASSWSGEPTWFSRSGSLLILCAAIVQYRYAVHRLGVAATLPTTKCAGTIGSLRMRNLCGRLSFWAVVVGTLLWGYGDLVFA